MKQLLTILIIYAPLMASADPALRITVEGLNIVNGVTNVVASESRTYTDTNKIASVEGAAADVFGNGTRLSKVFRFILRSTADRTASYEAQLADDEILALIAEKESEIREKRLDDE